MKIYTFRNINRPFWGSSLHIFKFQLLASPAKNKQSKPPSAVQSNDPYTVLQVTPGSSLVDIKAAYYQKIKVLHPDVNQGDDTTKEAVALNMAYASLIQGKHESFSFSRFIEMAY